MGYGIYSIGWRNAYGNIGSGICLLMLGTALFAGSMEGIGLASAVLLLGFSSVALYACLSKNREAVDEMAIADEQAAASLAIKMVLILLGIAACIGVARGAQVNLGALACFTIGVAMVTYGAIFAWLERF